MLKTLMKKKSFVYGGFSFLFIALIVFLMFGSLKVPVLSDLGDKILGKQQQDVKGIEEKKEIIEKDIIGKEPVVETESPEALEEDTGATEKPTNQKTPTVSKPVIDGNIARESPSEIDPTNNPPIQEEQPNYCKESDISEYRQIIETSERTIKIDEAFIANPKNYDYTYKYDQCGWTYDDCMEAADAYFLQTTGWTYLESGSHGCSRVASCAGALKTRTEMMNVCYSDLNLCRSNLDNIWLANKIAEAKKEIEWRKQLIIENQNKLANCGL